MLLPSARVTRPSPPSKVMLPCGAARTPECSIPPWALMERVPPAEYTGVRSAVSPGRMRTLPGVVTVKALAVVG